MKNAAIKTLFLWIFIFSAAGTHTAFSGDTSGEEALKKTDEPTWEDVARAGREHIEPAGKPSPASSNVPGSGPTIPDLLSWSAEQQIYSTDQASSASPRAQGGAEPRPDPLLEAARRHPGVEHTAGTAQGGTFILVNEKEEAVKNEPLERETVPPAETREKTDELTEKFERLKHEAMLQEEARKKVDELTAKFERLKRETMPPKEKYSDRLLREQRVFRERFTAEHGDPFTWDEAMQKRYEKEFNAFSDSVKARWQEDEKTRGEKNRELGRTIRELAQARADLKEEGEKTPGPQKTLPKNEAEQAKEPAVEQAEEPVVEQAKEPVVERAKEPVVEQAEELPVWRQPAGGVRVASIECYAEDYSDGTIGTWNSRYPACNFDDEEGRSGKPNGVWKGSYAFEGDELLLVIDGLTTPYPPVNSLGIGYTVTLENGTFAESGTAKGRFIMSKYSGTPENKKIIKRVRVVPAEDAAAEGAGENKTEKAAAKGATSGDPKAAPEYFKGQLLADDDLTQSVDYTREKLKLKNR